MARVCNDPELMRELELLLRGFREAACDGVERLTRVLETDLAERWRGQQSAESRERISRNLRAFHRLVVGVAELEALASRIRKRLEAYLHEESSSVASTSPAADSAREIVRRLLIRGTVEAIVRWFRAHPYVAHVFLELLKALLTDEASRQLCLLLVLRELLFPTFLDAGDHPLPVSCRESAVPVLLKLLASSDPGVRRNTVELLGRIGINVADAIALHVDDPVTEVASAATSALGNMSGEMAVRALLRASRNGNPEIRRAAVDSLAVSRSSMAIPFLRQLANHPDPHTRHRANAALREHDGMDRVERKLDSLSVYAQQTNRADFARAARAASMLVSVASGHVATDSLSIDPSPVAFEGGTVQLPSGGAAAKLSISMLTSQASEAHLEVRHPAFRATAAAVLAIRARSTEPERAVALAHRAVVEATAAGDRGLLATALAVRAAVESQRGSFAESLASSAEAQRVWSESTVGDRCDWAVSPIALAITSGRAATLAKCRPSESGIVADILCDIFQMLMRAIGLGCALVMSVAGILLQWAFNDFATIYALEAGSEAGD
jgi:hypothetical protein